MTRLRRPGKEKAVDPPSKPAAAKKRKTTGISIREPVEEEREVQEEPQVRKYGDPPYKGMWVNGQLSKLPLDVQPELFYEKMGDAHSIKENMMCEKTIMGSDFKALGFFEKFTELGWEAVLSFKGHSNGDVYVKSIMEWMSTLTKDDGNDPPKTITLSGKVNNKTVTLSPATMRSLAKFDSKADSFYQIVKPTDYFSHPEKLVASNVLNTELFMLNKGEEMKRDNLKPNVRLLLSYLLTNVTPRTGDRVAVRKSELPVLYALMTGQLHLSFRQLVIMHVWQARNQKNKKLIPHARLLSALLEKHGALRPGEHAFRKPHTIFALADVCKSEKILYKKTKLWHKIKFGDGVKLKVLQWGKQAPSGGEMDDQDSSDEEVMRQKREAGEIVGAGSSAQVEEPVRSGPRQSAHSWGVFDDAMQARVESMRPPEYVAWEPFQQALYDQGSRLGVERERQHNELMAHQRAVHIGNEMNLNLWAYDENQRRRHNDYCMGVPFVQNPPYVDYSKLPPFQPGMVRPPTPQVHGSMWLPRVYSEPHFQSSYPFRPPPYQYPSQQQNQQEQQSSSAQQQQDPPATGGLADIFDMNSFYDTLSSYYGGPKPSYD
ncbi:hypothetical protein HanPI659440_Chr10g0380951 [Helianthus annuus]|nr:hypothetical protein HanPI659440_Chr10g0380951 [Helianthus annuus]